MSLTRKQRLSRKRRKRVRAADNDLSEEQWQMILRAWEGKCAYCGAVKADLQKDCVLPISRGGSYTIRNVVPACRSCNASKSNSEVTAWMRRKKMDEPRFLETWVKAAADVIAMAAPK